MKKIISILLAALLVAAILPTAAFADGPAVVLSPQNLRVDGKVIACEKYNIDGSNYFKLRDIAMVLSGTGSQFSVGWDGEKKVISVVTGESYEPNGSELDLSAGDKSATAVPSTQTLLINGAERGDLSAYNIGGNNFFKLRDLGDALGFQVNYDKASNTAIVISHAWSWPTKWLTQEYIYNEDGAATSHTLITYDENGMMMSYLSESEYDTYSCSYTYNEVGRTEAMVSDSVYVYHDGERFEDHTTVTYEYDIWGNLVREISESTGDVYSETSYTYDDNGNILVAETLNNYGSSATYYTYDENGRQIKVAYADNDEVMNVDEYFRDADGNIIKQVSTYGDEVSSWAEFTLVDGLVTQETWGYGEDSYTYFYTYDDNGNVIHSEYRSPYGSTVTNNIYDAQGREVQSETTYDGGSTLTVWTYDEQGNLVKYERTDSSGFYSVDETSYDEEGNILKEVSRVNGTVRTYTYTYDLEARKMTCLVVTEYEAVG